MNTAIELSGVQKSFGKTHIIRGVDLKIKQGTIHAIIGPNGAGKSTLFNLVTGRYHVDVGKICLNGEDITNCKPFHIYRKGLSRSFQVTNIFPKMSVRENIRCAMLWNFGFGYSFWKSVNSNKHVQTKCDNILVETDLVSRRDMPAGLLSYSDQRALEIAVTIAGGSKVVMLDEPTSGMSASETDHTVRLIRRISSERTMIIVEHDMNVVFDVADYVSVLVYGKIIATAPPNDIRNNAEVQKAYLGTDFL